MPIERATLTQRGRPPAPPQAEAQGQQGHGRPHQAHGRVARCREDHPAPEAAQGGNEADQEVVRALGARALGRGQPVGEEGRAAHVAEIPAQAEKEEGQGDGKEIGRKGRGQARSDQHHRSRHDYRSPAPVIREPTRDQREGVHAYDVRRDHERDTGQRLSPTPATLDDYRS